MKKFLVGFSFFTLIFLLSSCLQSANTGKKSKGLGITNTNNGGGTTVDPTDFPDYPNSYNSYDEAEVIANLNALLEDFDPTHTDNQIRHSDISGVAPTLPLLTFNKADAAATFHIYLQGNNSELISVLQEFDEIIDSISWRSTTQYSQGPLKKYKVQLVAGVRAEPFLNALREAGISHNLNSSSNSLGITYFLTPQGEGKLPTTTPPPTTPTVVETTPVYQYYYKRSAGGTQTYIYSIDPHRATTPRRGDLGPTPVFKAFSTSGTDRVPVYLFKRKTANTYKYLLSRANALSGWINIGTAFFAYASGNSDRVAIRQLYNENYASIIIYVAHPNYPAANSAIQELVGPGSWKLTAGEPVFWVPK